MTASRWRAILHRAGSRRGETISLNDLRQAVVVIAKKYVEEHGGLWIDDHRAELPDGDILVIVHARYEIDEITIERYECPTCVECGMVRYKVVGLEKGIFAQLMCPACGHRNERYIPPAKD